MEHRKMLCNSRIIYSDMEQQGQDYVYSDLSIHFGGTANFPQPNVRAIVTASGSSSTFETHYMTDHYDNSMLYGMPQYNGVQHHRSLELGVPIPANFYSSYTTPSSSAVALPVPLHHGASNQFPSSGSYGVGVPTFENGRNNHFIDDVRGPCKRKTPEDVLGNCPHYNPCACPCSSVAHLNTRHPEGVAAPNVASFYLPQYIGNGNQVMEVGPQSVGRDRPVASGLDSFLRHDHNHISQQNYMGPPFQPAGALGFEQLNNGSASGSVSAWNQSPGITFMHEAASVGLPRYHESGLPRYHETSGSTSSRSHWHPPPINHWQQNYHSSLPTQGFRGHNMNVYPQATTDSYRIPSNVLSRRNINPSQNVGFEMGDRQQPVRIPPTGFRIFRPHQGVNPESSLRHQNLPHMRFLPADEVAMLEISDFYEVGSLVDHNRDMRLDIEDMSYEELLSLEERIGHVSIGLSEETIMNKLKTKTHLSSAITTNVEEGRQSSEKETDLCIICQENYKHLEKIGTLNCGHEYHVECLKEWLLLKNVCPICKSPAL